MCVLGDWWAGLWKEIVNSEISWRPATKGLVVRFNIEEFGLYGDMEEFH